MTWYKTGAISVTNGSTAVAGIGTSWVDHVKVGDAFVGPDGRTYEIASVTSATALSLALNYGGATTAGQAYAIQPTRAVERELATSLQALLTDYSGIAEGPGTGKFAEGTLAAPGLRFSNDADTGLTRLTANFLSLVAGGIEQLRLGGGIASGAAVQSNATDVTAGRLARADFAYGPGNLLGSVTQAGGVPTGAVIERGANANGEYARLADGTQICTGSSFTITSGGGTVWTYPASFFVTPKISVIALTGSPRTVTIAARSSSSVDVTAWDHNGSNTVSTAADLLVIGRWF